MHCLSAREKQHHAWTGPRAQDALLMQVDGCCEDLTNLKEYHQRYKICERHLKMSEVFREGNRMRFCQQCGRFHPLNEFDGDKRSCRARLQRHNARRRKKGDADAAMKASAPKKQRPPGKRSPVSDDNHEGGAADAAGGPAQAQSLENGARNVRARFAQDWGQGAVSSAPRGLDVNLPDMLGPQQPTLGEGLYHGVDLDVIRNLLRGQSATGMAASHRSPKPAYDLGGSGGGGHGGGGGLQERFSLAETFESQRRMLDSRVLHNDGGVPRLPAPTRDDGALYGNSRLAVDFSEDRHAGSDQSGGGFRVYDNP